MEYFIRVCSLPNRGSEARVISGVRLSSCTLTCPDSVDIKNMLKDDFFLFFNTSNGRIRCRPPMLVGPFWVLLHIAKFDLKKIVIELQ